MKSRKPIRFCQHEGCGKQLRLSHSLHRPKLCRDHADEERKQRSLKIATNSWQIVRAIRNQMQKQPNPGLRPYSIAPAKKKED